MDPFAANVNPCDWRMLQDVAARKSDPAEAVREAGVSCADGAVHYLTRNQLVEVSELLDSMFDTLDFDQTRIDLG